MSRLLVAARRTASRFVVKPSRSDGSDVRCDVLWEVPQRRTQIRLQLIVPRRSRGRARSVCIFPKCEQLRESATAPGTNLNNTHDPFSREAGRWSLLFRREVSVLIGSLIGLASKLPGFPDRVESHES